MHTESPLPGRLQASKKIWKNTASNDPLAKKDMAAWKLYAGIS